MYAAPLNAQNAAPSIQIPMPPSLLSAPQYNPYMHQQSGPYGHLSSIDSYASQLHPHNGMGSSSFLQQIPGSALSFLAGGASGSKKKDKKHSKKQQDALASSTRPQAAVIPPQDDNGSSGVTSSPGKSSSEAAASSLLASLVASTVGSWPSGSGPLLSRQQSSMGGGGTSISSSLSAADSAAVLDDKSLQAAVLNNALFSFPAGYYNGRGAPSWSAAAPAAAAPAAVVSDEHDQQHSKKTKHPHSNDDRGEADKTGMADILVSLKQSSVTNVNGDAVSGTNVSDAVTGVSPGGAVGGTGRSMGNAEKKVDRILVKPASEHDAGGTDEMLAFDRKNMPVRSKYLRSQCPFYSSCV